VLIDAATLHDLDVLNASTPRGQTLWSLVDRTRSPAGREHLRRSLIAPGHTAADIVQRQRAHQALARDLDGYGRLLDAIGADGVDRYLGATWQLPSAQPALAGVGLWRPAWFKEYLRAIDDGRTRVLAALDAAAALRDRLAATDGELLQGVAATLTSALASPPVRQLRALAHGRSASARMAFDGIARDTGRPILAALLDAIGAVDAMWSLAAATAARNWTYPRPSTRLAVEGLYNPFLDPGQGGVANDLRLHDGTRVCVVTGPNMAGKSTFLRAIAIAVLLAHAGCGVPALSMEFPARCWPSSTSRSVAPTSTTRPKPASVSSRAWSPIPARSSSSPRTWPKWRPRFATIPASSSSASRPISPAIGRCSTTGSARASRRSGSA
jgi:hypothetical protein